MLQGLELLVYAVVVPGVEHAERASLRSAYTVGDYVPREDECGVVGKEYAPGG